jgi:hypothetical protein
MKLKVFNPRLQIDVFVDWLGYSFLNEHFESSDSVNDVLEQDDIKIACLPVFFDRYTDFKNNPFDIDKFDLILLSDVEANNLSVVKNWIANINIKNYLLSIGCLDNAELQENILYRPWWSFNIVNQNSFSDVFFQNKEFDFDVLLGARRDHRDFVMAKMQTSGLISKSIVNYRSLFEGVSLNDFVLQKRIKEILQNTPLNFPYISSNLQEDWEVKTPLTKDVSDQVPWQIYSKTKYSILCETIYREPFFMTEKTGKAIFAKRLFIVFSSPLFLKNLKNLGFKTFSNVIDESYDLEFDTVERFEKAFRQIQWLADQNYESVIAEVKLILDYNHNRLLEYKKEIEAKMKSMVYNTIREKHVNSLFKK